AIRGCSLVIVMIAILNPLPDVTGHVVEPERIGLERSDWRGLLIVPLAATAVAVGIVSSNLVAPEIGRRAASASRVFPFRLGEQSIGLASHLRKPRHILLGVVPADIDDRHCCPPKATIANLRTTPY